MILDPEMDAKTMGGKQMCLKRDFLLFLIASGVLRGAKNGPKIDAKSMPKRSRKPNASNNGFASTAQSRKSSKIMSEIDRKTDRGTASPKS